MLTLMVVVLGAVSLSRLQIDLLPNIELPTLTVRTQYEGADPVVMERLVTQIVEEIVGTVPGVEELTSTSYEGNSSVKVKFGWGTHRITSYNVCYTKLLRENLPLVLLAQVMHAATFGTFHAAAIHLVHRNNFV